MTLFSRQPLTESVARKQITALSEFEGGLLRPDKWSKVEPIRTPFDPNDIINPIQSLAEPHGEFFYRKGNPVLASGEIWNLTHPPTARFPSPLFSNYWTGRFDAKWAAEIGLEMIEDFVSEMFQVTHSDFGLLTPEVDLEAKNSNAKSHSYQGLKLETGVPGLYWINFFSQELADWLGIENLPNELATKRALPRRGVSLKFSQSPEQSRSHETLDKQKAIIECLGPGKFFDIQSPERTLDAPNWNRIAS